MIDVFGECLQFVLICVGLGPKLCNLIAREAADSDCFSGSSRPLCVVVHPTHNDSLESCKYIDQTGFSVVMILGSSQLILISIARTVNKLDLYNPPVFEVRQVTMIYEPQTHLLSREAPEYFYKMLKVCVDGQSFVARRSHSPLLT